MAAGLAAVGVGVAGYLTYEKVSGVVGPCVIGAGCDIVNSSPYSSVLGIPVAAFGVLWSGVALFAALYWWRRRELRALYLLYAGGLLGTLVEGYLLYLQLFVIQAICSWCIVYGATVIVGWLVALTGVMRTRRA